MQKLQTVVLPPDLLAAATTVHQLVVSQTTKLQNENDALKKENESLQNARLRMRDCWKQLTEDYLRIYSQCCIMLSPFEANPPQKSQYLFLDNDHIPESPPMNTNPFVVGRISEMQIQLPPPTDLIPTKLEHGTPPPMLAPPPPSLTHSLTHNLHCTPAVIDTLKIDTSLKENSFDSHTTPTIVSSKNSFIEPIMQNISSTIDCKLSMSPSDDDLLSDSNSDDSTFAPNSEIESQSSIRQLNEYSSIAVVWSVDRSNKLRKYVKKYGCDDWEKVALNLRKHIPSVTAEMCANKWNAIKSMPINKKRYRCDICEKDYATKASLKNHMYSHTGNYPFRCDYSGCTKAFASKSILQSHITVVHIADKKFTCEYCGKKFVRKYDCQRHTYIHTGEKPYKCSRCVRGFTQSYECKKHEKQCMA